MCGGLFFITKYKKEPRIISCGEPQANIPYPCKSKRYKRYNDDAQINILMTKAQTLIIFPVTVLDEEDNQEATSELSTSSFRSFILSSYFSLRSGYTSQPQVRPPFLYIICLPLSSISLIWRPIIVYRHVSFTKPPVTKIDQE